MAQICVFFIPGFVSRQHSRRHKPLKSLAAEPAPVAIFTSEICVGHEPGWLHPDTPKRLSSLLSHMRTDWASEFGPMLRISEPEADATEEQLLRVHTPRHLALLKDAFESAERWPLYRANIDGDTVVSPGSRAAASRAAGLVVAAVDEVFSDSSALKRAFVMVRPPGHHAEADRPMGFCLFNNVMVGVAHAQAVHGLGRVAVIDFDVHHGNGDAALASPDPTRLYASSHQSPLFPGTGLTPGRSGPHGGILSAPLPAGAGSDEFRAAWRDQLLPVVAEFGPEASAHMAHVVPTFASAPRMCLPRTLFASAVRAELSRSLPSVLSLPQLWF